MCACATFRRARGAALVIAMLVMAVLLMAGTTFLTISSTESQIALNEQVSTQAFLVAEAAIHKAIAQLNANSGYTGETNTALGSGKFTLTVTTTSGCTATSARNLVVTATVPIRGGQAQVQLQATVDRVSYPFRWGAFATKSDSGTQELFLDKDSSADSFDTTLGAYNASVSGTTNVGKQGNIGANGDVYLEDNVQVKGNATGGGTISKKSGATVTGSETASFSPAESFPTVTPGTTGTSALNITAGSTLAAGTYYYTNITDSGSNPSLTPVGGPVTIYVTNTSGKVVNLRNDVTLGDPNAPGNLRIITKSDGPETDFVTFKTGRNFTFSGSLYGKNTDVDLGNTDLLDDAKISGSIIARTIRTGRRVGIHYDHAMAGQEVCHNGKFNIRRGTWREMIP